MASFQLDIKPNRLAGARFVNRVRSKLQEALVADQKRTGVSQSKIAEAIGVHRSVISRELNGRQDITLGRVAELAWAMGREIEFELRVSEVEVGQNVPERPAGALPRIQKFREEYPQIGRISRESGTFTRDEARYMEIGPSSITPNEMV